MAELSIRQQLLKKQENNGLGPIIQELNDFGNENV